MNHLQLYHIPPAVTVHITGWAPIPHDDIAEAVNAYPNAQIDLTVDAERVEIRAQLAYDRLVEFEHDGQGEPAQDSEGLDAW